jgi:hypothetical protein
MHRFLIGYSLPFAACVAVAGWTHGRLGAVSTGDWAVLALTLLIVPVLSGLGAVSFVQIRRPRRWLMRGAPGAIRAALLGMAAAVTAIPLIAAVLYVVNRQLPGTPEFEWDPTRDVGRVPDTLVVAPICLATAGIAAWLLPTRRAGTCAKCGYDVRYSLDSGRCPECGRAI